MKVIEISKPIKWQCLFSFIVWLAVCPLWGQTNLGIQGYLREDRLVLGLDVEVLERPMLLVRHKAGYHQVQWRKEGEHILLSLDLVPSETGVLIPPLPKNQRIEHQLLGRFPILKNESSEQLFFIDVTDLFLKTFIRWGLHGQETLVGNLSFIKEIEFLEDELLVRTTRTIVRQGDNHTQDVFFSLFRLPEPMRPRLFDHRMGFGSESMYSLPNREMKSPVGSIVKWRLVKKDGDRPLSTPKAPLVFYLDPKIPDQWKPYVRAGILEWLPAFEESGFMDALEVRDWPTGLTETLGRRMGFSMIHWSNSHTIRGRDGGGSYCEVVTDYRSGEILKADVYLADPKGLALDYFVRCSPLDKRAQHFPFPDDLMGELIQSVTAHEVGHAFGLRDGNYGEYAYPFERIRDTQWLQPMGHVPSIMSYSRHHHLGQPEDNIPKSLLVQGVGPMDHYQIKWGYIPIPEAKDFWAEQPYLEKIVRLQDTIPWYRFTLKTNPSPGPGSTEEVADNNAPIKSMALGLKNLERVMELIPELARDQKDDALLEQLHERMMEFWYKQMYHVVSMVGGYSIQYKNGNQTGPVYTPIRKKDQLQALEFLLKHGFGNDTPWSRPSYGARLRFGHDKDVLLGYQLMLLKELMDPDRWKRLEFMEDVHGLEGLVESILFKIQEGLFKELSHKKIKIERRRQGLQMAYLMELEAALGTKRDVIAGLAGYNRFQHGQFTLGIFRSNKELLKKKILWGLNHTGNISTEGHLRMCKDYLIDENVRKK